MLRDTRKADQLGVLVHAKRASPRLFHRDILAIKYWSEFVS